MPYSKARQEKDVDDEFTTYGKTVADTIQKLSRISQIYVKKKIDHVLFEVEVGAMGTASGDGPISVAEYFQN